MKDWLRYVRARALATMAKRRAVPRSAFVATTAQVLGWRRVRIGENVMISEGCWLNVNNPGSPSIQIDIGDSTFIGRRNVISSGERITFGPFCLTGYDCSFLCSDHRFADPFKPFAMTGNTAEGVMTIGANCWFAAGVKVMGPVTIGHGCVIGAGAVVRTDIPPFSVAVGDPARVVKRFDVSSGEWVRSDDFTGEGDIPAEEAYIRGLAAFGGKKPMAVQATGSAAGDMP